MHKLIHQHSTTFSMHIFVHKKNVRPFWIILQSFVSILLWSFAANVKFNASYLWIVFVPMTRLLTETREPVGNSTIPLPLWHRPNMALTLVLGVVAGALALAWMLWRNSHTRRLISKLPGPAATPLIGNALQLPDTPEGMSYGQMRQAWVHELQ